MKKLAHSFNLEFETAKGPVAVMADVFDVDGTLLIENFMFYPVGTERLELGVAGVRAVLRQLEEFAKENGYTVLDSRFHRHSGATPGRAGGVSRRLR